MKKKEKSTRDKVVETLRMALIYVVVALVFFLVVFILQILGLNGETI